jgi:hypothetical protein
VTGADLAERLGFGDWGKLWVAGLERLDPPPGGVELPSPHAMAALLERLGVPPPEAADVLATVPSQGGSPEWWWLLERCAGRLVATMGDPDADRGPWPNWVGSKPSLEQRCFFVHVFVATLPFTLEWHRAHGVPEEVSWETMADLARHMELHRRIFGSTGVDNAWWLTLCLRAELFELGRLQFNRFRLGFGDESPPWYSEAEAEGRGGGFRQGDACVGVHIPESGPMSPEACDESFARARELFSSLFPVAAGQERRLATCLSWLLDDQLAMWLPAESNIVRFQRRFELVPGGFDGDALVVEFVFRRPVPRGGLDEAFLSTLSQRTTLERAIVAHLRAGGHWREQTGWVEL